MDYENDLMMNSAKLNILGNEIIGGMLYGQRNFDTLIVSEILHKVE